MNLIQRHPHRSPFGLASWAAGHLHLQVADDSCHEDVCVLLHLGDHDREHVPCHFSIHMSTACATWMWAP